MSGQKKSFPLRLFEILTNWYSRLRYGREETAWCVEWFGDSQCQWQQLHTWYDDFVHETIRLNDRKGMTLDHAIRVMISQLKRFEGDPFYWRVRNAVTQEIIPAEFF